MPVMCPSGVRRHQCIFYSCRAPSELTHSRAGWLGWGRPQGTGHCVTGPFVTVGTWLCVTGPFVTVGTWLCVTGPFATHHDTAAGGCSVQRRQWDRVVLQEGPVQPPCSSLSPSFNHFFCHVPLGTDLSGTKDLPAWPGEGGCKP